MKLIEKEVSLPVFIPFTSATKQYGRAEFIVCPIFKNRKLVQVHIYPAQQPDAKEIFIVNCKLSGISFQSYEELGDIKIWTSSWCKEHKCFSLRLYVPTDSKYLYLDNSLGQLCFNFTKTNWKNK